MVSKNKNPPSTEMTDIEFEPRPQLIMKPGVEYLGYASINTYGEINFRPKVKEESSGAEGAETLKRTDGITICQTRKTFLIHMTFSKERLSFKEISNKMLAATQLLTHYIKRK